MQHAEIVIIGAGQAGLATAFAARQAGLRPVLLEAADQAGGAWPSCYDSLTLFSPARYSTLPGRPFPGDGDRYPRRDEVADYLRACAAELDAELLYGQPVTCVSMADGGGLVVTTATGTCLTTDRLVAASGMFGCPWRPALPGLPEFGGDLLHSSEYREPRRFAGARVVVVGGGNSAVQIAVELAAFARVSLATRSPLRWIPQRPLGRDLHWWLTRSGVDTAPLGGLLRGWTMPVLDDGRYRAAVMAGSPDRRPMFERVTTGGVVWSGGIRERVDALILATGYRPHLDYLAGSAALAADGAPLHRDGLSTTVPGLGYVGLEYQRSISSATLRGVGRDARHVIERLGPGRARR